MDVGRFKGLYTGLIFDYRLRLWAATSASHAVSVVAELLVLLHLPAGEARVSTGCCCRRLSSD